MSKTKISKIAKDLNIALSTVFEFLKKQNIPVEEHPNARVEDDVVRLLTKEFQPDRNYSKSPAKSTSTGTLHSDTNDNLLICRSCGFDRNPSDSHYCGNCGHQLIYGENYRIYNASFQTPVDNSTLRNYKRYEQQVKSSWIESFNLGNAGAQGRNAMCPCGSGKKFMDCHGK